MSREAANIFQTEIRFKMDSFQNYVVKPAAQYLALKDKDAFMGIAGSNGGFYRTGSDYDLLILSRGLKDPVGYMSFLVELQDLSECYLQDLGKVPYWFTRLALEDATGHISRTFFEKSNGFYTHNFIDPLKGADLIEDEDINNVSFAQGFLPGHFLFYPDKNSFYGREPKLLADRLLKFSKPILGEKPSHSLPNQTEAEESGLDNSRWNVERALAELVLNFHHLPLTYLATQTKNVLISTIRGPMGDTLLGEDSKAKTGPTIKYIEEITGNKNLSSGVDVYEDIHMNGSDKSYDLESLAELPIELMKAIDVLIAKGY